MRNLLLLLLLSLFSCVRFCVTPEMAAHQAPPSLGFSRQEHWSGLPFPSPMRESEVAQSCLTLRDPMDCSLPGSSIHGIFQSRVRSGLPLPSPMTNLDSILKSRDNADKAMVFPAVMCGCESWTTKKAEGQRIDAFILWC